MDRTQRNSRRKIVIIGTGVAGLVSAIRLATHGFTVLLLEQHAQVGGKMRTTDSLIGPVDAGPTVLTLRQIFDEVFLSAGRKLDDYVTLISQKIIARHWWPDGATLDLYSDREQSAAAIQSFSGDRSAAEFRAYCERCEQLFHGFEELLLRNPNPRITSLTWRVLRQPQLIRHMNIGQNLAGRLKRDFSDPRLAQLFGRYATYVGGSPVHTPAILGLIWHAEASGVWTVKGGMHQLALGLSQLAVDLGASVQRQCKVERIEIQNGRVTGVALADGRRISADTVVFNGDPRALSVGALGANSRRAATRVLRYDRSYSARVYSFAAEISGCELVHHNVFFADDLISEFNDLQTGRIPKNPSLYLCAEDRGQNHPTSGLERFEIIANAPANQQAHQDDDLDQWHQNIFRRLSNFGVTFHPVPTLQNLTTPRDFHHLFPESLGALYGQSPHGMLAALKRPRAKTRLVGLYLAGGGTHPGAGVPMAALSGMHAAEAIVKDQTLA
ncbi:MAG: phytoene desaturase family protein [Aestuariivita sp.]|nr:phytoene desaturase family protein [Aestuariivita sp.]MCY4201572.1 phytoene desaturase family protein [Aestuariivita sp.]MCY4289154.1 phytoene desaturase family protein [Aestuariivita sp.]MCY4347957.1 phytoene desaturase family protein [Aestuariivita sp.]